MFLSFRLCFRGLNTGRAENAVQKGALVYEQAVKRMTPAQVDFSAWMMMTMVMAVGPPVCTKGKVCEVRISKSR